MRKGDIETIDGIRQRRHQVVFLFQTASRGRKPGQPDSVRKTLAELSAAGAEHPNIVGKTGRE